MPFLCRFLNRGSMKLRHGKSSSLPTFKELESFFILTKCQGIQLNMLENSVQHANVATQTTTTTFDNVG